MVLRGKERRDQEGPWSPGPKCGAGRSQENHVKKKKIVSLLSREESAASSASFSKDQCAGEGRVGEARAFLETGGGRFLPAPSGPGPPGSHGQGGMQFQERAITQLGNGGLWSISVGGDVGKGEDSLPGLLFPGKTQAAH